MKKWIKRIAIVLLVLLIVLFIGANWIIKEAFGPKHKTVIIHVDSENSLTCEETYTADMAAMFYDVDFSLKNKNNEAVNLGTATFPTENWRKDIRLYHIDNWNVLSANGQSYSKLLMTNQFLNKQQDTVFSPLELRYDSLWKLNYNDIPSWPYSGSSNIDTLIGDKIQVSYQYRIGDYPPFKFYSQTIEYKVDATTGHIKTIKVLERNEKKNGS
jgi:hypothetical protein